MIAFFPAPDKRLTTAPSSAKAIPSDCSIPFASYRFADEVFDVLQRCLRPRLYFAKYFSHLYVRRSWLRPTKQSPLSKNQLAITEKGTLLLVEAVAGNKMSDVAFTAEWEKYLAKIHKGEGDQAYFLENIKHFVLEILGTKNEMLQSERIAERIDAAGDGAVVGVCPVCGKEAIIKGSYLQCQDYGEACSFRISRYIARRYLSPEEAKELLARKETKRFSGFKKKDGKSFSTALLLGKDEAGNYAVSFKPFAPSKKNRYAKKHNEQKKVSGKLLPGYLF